MEGCQAYAQVHFQNVLEKPNFKIDDDTISEKKKKHFLLSDKSSKQSAAIIAVHLSAGDCFMTLGWQNNLAWLVVGIFYLLKKCTHRFIFSSFLENSAFFQYLKCKLSVSEKQLGQLLSPQFLTAECWNQVVSDLGVCY